MSWVDEADDADQLANILSSHSLNRPVMEAHLRLFRRIMHGPSGLSRAEREAIAAYVSAANDCHY